MSIQGVMNTRLSEKIGLYEANLFIQGIAFLLSIVAMFLLGRGNLSLLGEVNQSYLFGGVFGLVITVTVMLGIQNLSPTVSISIILIAQLLVAALIDFWGLLGTQRMVFGWSKYAGISLMILGVILFKWQRT